MTTCSRASLLRGAVHSLFAQTGLEDLSVELVVVDDASTDNTREVLEELAAVSPFPMTLLRGARQGVAAARNLAASAALGTWLVSFDDDELAAPDWLSHLYNTAMANHADCVSGSTFLTLPAGRFPSEFGDRARGLLGEFVPGGHARPFPAAQLPATNNVLFLRRLYTTLNGYDPRFTEGGEDTDFFARMKQHGARLWIEPMAAAQHLIPERRIAPGALHLTAMRTGTIEARKFLLRSTRAGALRFAVLRSAVAVVRDVPQLVLAKLTHKRALELDAQLSLAFTSGYLRAVYALRKENSNFISSMDFRIRHGERDDPTAR